VVTGGLLVFAILVPLVMRGMRNNVELTAQKKETVV